MLHTIKKRLYFVAAAYFAFWAKFVLKRWKPRIVVITGSSGKTTTLHLVEAQLGDKAIYTHHANSSIGIPFHLLGMMPNVLHKWAWPIRFLTAPFHIFRKLPGSKLYIVEADCDRPHEGEFLAKLLKPEVLLWVSVYRTHSMSFDSLVASKKFATHEEAIAYEFGNFVAATTKMVIANGDQPLLVSQLGRVESGVNVMQASLADVSSYRLSKLGTDFIIKQQPRHVPGLHPKELGVSLQLVDGLLQYLNLPLDPTYQKFTMPPGRTNTLLGKKDTVLIDSTYNTSVDAVAAVLDLFDIYPSDHKWLVLSDILEQGSIEQAEHERLADLISKHKLEQIILLGPRMEQYTFPKLKLQLPNTPIAVFKSTGDGLKYLEQNLKGGEAILFKGARGLEGIVEALLANPADANQLVRREAVWVKRRQAWGLPK